jgi:hypothetical protein
MHQTLNTGKLEGVLLQINIYKGSKKKLDQQ